MAIHGYSAETKYNVALQTCSVGCLLLTLGKFFPTRYSSCETRLCSKMVHTSCLTIACCVLDLIVIRAMHEVKKECLYRMECSDLVSRLLACFLNEEWVEFLLLFATLSNICSLLFSTAWVILDLQLNAEVFPGEGTLILGVVATACSCLVLAIEVFLWIRLYPIIMERLSIIVPRIFGIKFDYCPAEGYAFGVRLHLKNLIWKLSLVTSSVPAGSLGRCHGGPVSRSRVSLWFFPDLPLLLVWFIISIN